MNTANFLAAAAQVAMVVGACAGLPRLLGLRAPAVQYGFWRVVLIICLLLPVLQPRQPSAMTVHPGPEQSRRMASGPPAESDAPAGAASAPTFDWAAAAAWVIVLGIAARLAWLGLGLGRLRRLRRLAVEPALAFSDLELAIGAPAPIRWSAEVRHPLTFGLFNPVILLPLALKHADLPAQRAVVAHELHHVKRRDWGWILAEELIRSVFWFHPAVWWLVSRVQLARETVVDELSILATNARRTYLDTLLAFADDFGLASPPAFSARRHLFHRVMLLSQEGRMSSHRVAVASFVLLLGLGGGTWGAVRAFPLYGTSQDQRPPRDPIAVRKPSFDERVAQLQPLRIGGTIKPPTKIHDVKATYPPEALAAGIQGVVIVEALIDPAGDIADARVLRSIPALDDAALGAVRQWKFTPTLMNGSPSAVTMVVTVNFTQAQPSEAVAPSSAASTAVPMPVAFQALIDQLQPVRVGGNIKAPTKIKDVKPAYPPQALAEGVEGVVILEVLLGADGPVVDARIVRSVRLLDDAALDAVRQWAFVPTLLNGAPVPVLMTVTVNFTRQ